MITVIIKYTPDILTALPLGILNLGEISRNC